MCSNEYLYQNFVQFGDVLTQVIVIQCWVFFFCSFNVLTSDFIISVSERFLFDSVGGVGVCKN